jgi:hypothetical protein
MELIKNLKKKLLSNGWHLEFMVGMLLFSDQYNTVRMKLSGVLTKLRASVSKEDLSYKVIRKSDYSRLKAKLDKERDDLIVGFRETLKGALHHFNEAIREAANRIKLVFDEYNKPTLLNDLPYDAETIAINNMVEELETNYKQDIQLVGMANWLLELKSLNSDFEQLMLGYNREQAGKPGFNSLEARKETDEAYQLFVKALEGLMILEPEEPELVAFAGELNTWIKRYNTMAEQHKGRIHSGEENEENEEEEEE